MNPTIVGQSIVCSIEYRLEGVLIDPSIVKAFYRKPGGTLREINFPAPEFAKIDIGLYELTVLADESGTWAFRSVGVGVIDAVQEGVVNVAPSLVL